MKRVFEKRWIFVVTTILLLFITVILFFASAESFRNEFNYLDSLYVLLMTILSVICCVKLFEKQKNAVAYISLLLILLLGYLLYNTLSLSPFSYVFEPENIALLILIILYLVLINYGKVSSDNSEITKEIEQIGKYDER